MKRLPLALAALALATRAALAADPAELSIYLFDQQTPLADAEVQIDGTARGRTSADGAFALTLDAGRHRLSVLRAGAQVLQLELDLEPEENAELIVTLYPDSAPSVFIESSHQDAAAASAQATQAEAGPPGTFAGRVLNSEDGTPVANARVFVAGTPLDIVTDGDGRFSAPIAPGNYSISVIAPEFSSQTLDGVAITSEQITEKAIELTPSGVELPEFVVLEPFVEGSLAAFVEEKRTSSAVADILGAEQISRAGDSDAAGALKRVTGLTLVDGKFVYVRGLGERYSSVLLNGAQIPSPDPTRRVVPLDLFPTDVLSGILVQKTYSADMPGEFGGGTIQMRTRGVPESFLLRFQGTLGYADGTTGKEGLRSRGGGRDWLGRDDGFRAAPPGAFLRPLPPSNSAETRAIGASLVSRGLGIGRKEIGPNTGVAFSVGDDYRFGDDAFSVGFIASGRYSQDWDQREEQRAEFAILGDGTQVPTQRYLRENTERNIDSGLFLSVGSEIGEHHRLTASAMLFRQTQGEDRIDEGLRSSGNVEQAFSIEWIENQLLTRQLGGEHSLPALGGLKLDWQYTSSRANREVPMARSYLFSERDPGEFTYTNSFPPQIRYETLVDDVDESQLALSYPFEFGDARSLTVSAGGSALDRQRASDIFRFSFRNNQRPPLEPTPIDEIFTPEAILSGEIDLIATGRATDFYTARQSLDAWFLRTDLKWDEWRVDVGLRREANDQRVITQDPFQAGAEPIVASIDQADQLPAGTLTWSYSEQAQFRLAYSKTVSRPDFRELSSAPFTDPQLDITVIGNPELVQADIASADLRWEYYFNDLESFSVALFRKEFERPIELVRTPASDDLLELRNAETAQNQGIEFDLYRSFAFVENLDWLPNGIDDWLPWSDLYLGANYAWIDSEVDLGANAGIQTSAQRPLQGQSPYVANLSVSYLPADGKTEATLLYNVAGERISKVGESGAPDEYEQPFNQLDFTVSRSLRWDGWKLKLRLRNLLDPEVEFLQGDEVSRSYRKGREAAVSLEWKF
jgi:hypothetical protein